MSTPTDTFDISALRMTSGEGRRIEQTVAIEPFVLSDETYDVTPSVVAIKLDISQMTGQGYALRLRFSASLSGPCMRCLGPAAATFAVDSREVEQPDSDDPEMRSPYVSEGQLDLAAWARDALLLLLPAALLCRTDCAGLCPVCGVDLNEAGAEHHHEAEPDPRWAPLRGLNPEK
jgi:uncharacterized protein